VAPRKRRFAAAMDNLIQAGEKRKGFSHARGAVRAARRPRWPGYSAQITVYSGGICTAFMRRSCVAGALLASCLPAVHALAGRFSGALHPHFTALNAFFTRFSRFVTGFSAPPTPSFSPSRESHVPSARRALPRGLRSVRGGRQAWRVRFPSVRAQQRCHHPLYFPP
ncbi:MAG TPA: hypothetical protein VEN30_22800, partial [Paraburkholderia sp.]|nr:hypothetical protein [Paraburkholderia sp.]